MSIGLLIITHNQVGHTLLQTAVNMMGVCPLSTEALAVTTDCDPDELRTTTQRLIAQLDQGDGVLVLTDMYGSTPSNIAYDLLDEGRINVVAGINLPMLVRILNYAPLDLKELTNKAISGGKDGIVCCRKSEMA